MRTYKGVRCFQCDSVILASMPYVVRYPSRQPEFWMLYCPECSAITLQIKASALKGYVMPQGIRMRGYAKKGEWSEMTC
jgi:hypothetical protein